MLSDSCLPKSFWVEAISAVCFLVNRLPSTTTDKKTPKEAWYDTLPIYSDLNIFGCYTYAQVDNRKLNQDLESAYFLAIIQC